MAFSPSLKSKGNHAIPTHTYFSFPYWILFGIKQQNTLQNSIQIHTTQNWKGTGTYIYMDCYSILKHPALWCILDVLMEKISTLFNFVLSLPMLLWFTNMLTYTVLTLDCKYSYVRLWTLKHVQVHCSINVFCVLMALVYIHNTITLIQMWKVCGVLTANSDFKIYTVLMLIYNWGWQLSHKNQI